MCLKKKRNEVITAMYENFTLTGFSDEISEKITEQFEHLNKLGIEYFEPRGIDGKNISELTCDDVKTLKENMQKYGIKVSSIGSPIGKIGIKDDFDAHLELLKKMIGIAKELGTKYIRVFSFFIPKDENPEDYRDKVIKRMKAMTKLAEENDIILLHENEKEIYGDIAPRCLDILKSVDSPNLRAVFDPANFVQCGQKVYPDALHMLKDYVVYVHIKDALENGDVVPAGFGIGNVKEVLSELKQDGYKGFLSLEPHLGAFKGLENLELDDKMTKLDGSTPEKFTLAHDSLINILKTL